MIELESLDRKEAIRYLGGSGIKLNYRMDALMDECEKEILLKADLIVIVVFALRWTLTTNYAMTACMLTTGKMKNLIPDGCANMTTLMINRLFLF